MIFNESVWRGRWRRPRWRSSFDGLHIAAGEEARLKQIRLTEDEKTIFQQTRETFNSVVKEKAQGVVRMMRPVGSWRSKKEDYFDQAFVVRLAELQ